MFNKENCYLSLEGNTSSILKYFQENDNKINWAQTCPGVKGIFLEDDESNIICSSNKTLSLIQERVQIKHCGFLKIEANTWLQWHADGGDRHTAINCLLTPNVRSFCFFLENISSPTNFIELTYKENYFYLFNAQMFHTVVNMDKPRYMFSSSLLLDGEPLNFEKAKIVLSDIFVS